MRRTAPILLLLSASCIAGRSSLERDDHVLRELARQQRWAQQAVDARPGKEQLDRIRGGDYAAVGTARKELQRLILAIDRGTWVRESSAELMKEDGDPQLVQEFDRAGRLRTSAVHAADEVANALAEAKGGLTVGDLRPAYEALRKSQVSEDRLARALVKAGLPRLAPAPLPAQRPFVDAAARLVEQNAELARELDKLPPDDAARIRARLADLSRQKEEVKHAEAPPVPPPAAPPVPVKDSWDVPPAAPPPSGEMEAQAPSNTLKIDKDAFALLAKRPPRSITLREDGLFELSYEDGEYLVDPEGKLVRKEAAAPGAKK